jgi:hypothetical protein
MKEGFRRQDTSFPVKLAFADAAAAAMRGVRREV